MPPARKNSLKLDWLAVDPAVNQVLVEVKDASGSSSKIYYAPFQLSQNVWEWHFALDEVRNSLQELLEARVDPGLTSPAAPEISGGIRAVVGFGHDSRSGEVRRRYAQVMTVANAHLPPGVALIETWVLAEGREPVRIS